MPQAATANMGLVQPSENGDTDVWDTLLTTLFGRIDLHDHSTGLGVKVKPNGFDWNADLSATSGGTPYALTAAKAIDFTPVAASTVASYAGALFVNSDDANNLYFRTAAGSNVKVTNGAALNLSATGGIVGDYASIGAEAAYDDANDRYTWKQQSSGGVRQWARMSSASVDLYEYRAAGDVTNITNRVRHSSPAGLAASYELTWLAALPGSTQLLQVSSAGVITASNTVANAVTLSALLTCNAGVTTNEGDVRHAACETVIGIHSCTSSAGTRTRTKIAHGAAVNVWLPIDGKVGDKLTAARIRLDDLGGAGWVATLYRMTVSTRAVTSLGALSGGAGDAWHTITLGTPETLATDRVYFIEAVSGAAGGEAFGGSATFSRDS